MKKLIYILLLITTVGYSQSIKEIRAGYVQAADNKAAALNFCSLIENNRIKKPIIKVYEGAALTFRSKYAKPIKEKIRLFKEGAHIIDATIQRYPNDIEMRLIRLSIQENVPKILKYKKNIKEDRTIILKHYSKQSLALKQFIKGYIDSSKNFTIEEKNSLK